MPLPSVFQLLFSTVHFHHGEPRQSQTPHSKNKKCENRVFTDNTCSYFLFIPNIWLVIRITTTTLRAAERWIPLWEMPSGPALLLTASVVKTGVIGLLLPQHIPDCHYWCEIRALLWSDRSYHCEWSAQAHCENNTVVTHFNKGSEFNWWDNVRDGGGYVIASSHFETKRTWKWGSWKDVRQQSHVCCEKDDHGLITRWWSKWLLFTR